MNTTIEDFIIYISVFQGTSLKPGFLCRGGMAIGNLFMDSSINFVWGKALVETHRLEEKIAIYPRVVLSSPFDQFELSDTTRILKDFDGMYFVDYFSKIKKIFPEWIEGSKELIQYHYDKYVGKDRILQKYAWLQHYIE